MPELMMNPVRFRSLKKVPKPAWRLNVPMIKHFTRGNEERVVAGRSQIASEDPENNQARDNRVNENLDRMFVEGGEHLHPSRRVMDLMHGAPQELRFMAISMPPIKDERGKKINPERSSPRVQMVAEME
jgi:hypothetical protein